MHIYSNVCVCVVVAGLYGGDENASKAASLELNNLSAYMELNEPGLHVPLAALLDYAGTVRAWFTCFAACS